MYDVVALLGFLKNRKSERRNFSELFQVAVDRQREREYTLPFIFTWHQHMLANSGQWSRGLTARSSGNLSLSPAFTSAIAVHRQSPHRRCQQQSIGCAEVCVFLKPGILDGKPVKCPREPRALTLRVRPSTHDVT